MEQKTMEKIASGIKEVHNYTKQKEMANNCSTARFKKTEATMDQRLIQQFPKEKSLLYPCLQEPAYQNSSQPEKLIVCI